MSSICLPGDSAFWTRRLRNAHAADPLNHDHDYDSTVLASGASARGHYDITTHTRLCFTLTGLLC
jgi:hypothetical protein